MKKKCISIAVFLLALSCGSGSAIAAEGPNTGKLSLGYQGIIAGDFLQGVSSRYWVTNNIGSELNVFYGTAGIDFHDSYTDNYDGDVLLTTAKFLYAPVVKEHSRFYVGIEGGAGTLRGKSDNNSKHSSIYAISPLFGAEFNLAGIPELGLNWEVGYKYCGATYKRNGENVDVNISGTFVSLGAHYYF